MSQTPSLIATCATLFALSACGSTAPAEASKKAPTAAETQAVRAPAPQAKKRGVKPHYVKCDPAHPEMACTPDTPPLGIAPTEAPTHTHKPGVKPHYVKCDPAHPEMPCTPDTPPMDIELKADPTPPGVKPHHVPCDPNDPSKPCTPDKLIEDPTK
ncbi:MAG: hypothetical protein ACI9MR_000503 [Myxococcota bacterium]|jgi:hypothetical protein